MGKRKTKQNRTLFSTMIIFIVLLMLSSCGILLSGISATTGDSSNQTTTETDPRSTSRSVVPESSPAADSEHSSDPAKTYEVIADPPKTSVVTETKIVPKSVSVSKSSLSLFVGDSETVTAAISPSDADDKTVSWSSSNSAVASVSGGKITAVAPGNATIYAKTSNGVSAEIAVTVKRNIVITSELQFRRNEYATISIVAEPNTYYDIAVFYNSGKSKAEGLKQTKSDAEGNVSWTWKIGGRTAPGTYKVTISGNGEKITKEFTVIESDT